MKRMDNVKMANSVFIYIKKNKKIIWKSINQNNRLKNKYKMLIRINK